MPNILTSTQVPPVAAWDSYASNLFSLAAAGQGSGLAGPVSEGVRLGEGQTWPDKTCRNAVRLDKLARYGGGLYAVAKGLVLSAGSGLTASVAAGEAIVDGYIETAAQTIAVANNARSFIWLYRTGGLIATTALTLPALPAVLLGSVLTASGSVASVDTSGVLFLHGGMGTRTTADTGQPGDTPPSTTAFIAVTGGGRFLWDGAAYSYLPPTGNRETTVTLAARTVTLTPGTSYIIGADFSGVGVFGDALYKTLLHCSDANLIVNAAEGQRTTGKAFWTLHYAGTGSPLSVTLNASIKGPGWTGATSAGLAAGWDTPTAI